MGSQWKKPVKAAAMVAGLLCSSSAFAQSGPWTVSELSGQVSIGKAGVSKIAIKNSKVRIGDTVKTGRKGRAVLTRGEQYMVVSPNSHIQIAKPEKEGYVTRIVEYFGNVLFKVDKKKSKHFEVKTPYMAAVVKGTTFNVAVGEEGSTVQVTEGAVEVSTLDGEARNLLTPGMIGLIERNDPLALNILGTENKRIESPNRVNNRPAVKPTSIGSAASAVKNASIVREVVNAPVNLAETTNGLITGKVAGTRSAAQPTRTAAASNNGATNNSGGNSANPSAAGNGTRLALASEAVRSAFANREPIVNSAATENLNLAVLPSAGNNAGGNGQGNNGNGNNGNGNGNSGPANPVVAESPSLFVLPNAGNNAGGNGQGNNGNGNGNGAPNNAGFGDDDDGRGGGNGQGNNGNGNGNGGPNNDDFDDGRGGGNGQGNNGNGNGNGGPNNDDFDDGFDDDDDGRRGNGQGNNGNGNGNGGPNFGDGDDDDDDDRGGNNGRGNGRGNGGDRDDD